MKKLPLYNIHYQILEKGFSEWLYSLGFSENSVKNLPYMIREFLHHLEQNNIQSMDELEQPEIQQYIQHLKERSNSRHDRGLSVNYINKHLQALKKFGTYLRKNDKPSFAINEQAGKVMKNPYSVLSQKEVESLYSSTKDDVYGLRDRAILGLYYGAGLRRNEGVQLDVSDILFDHRMLYVRKGKNFTERYVPLNHKILFDLNNYMKNGRDFFCKENNQKEAFLISLQGKRIDGMSVCLRIKHLQKNCESETLKNKNIGLHSLRHSIATHLLHSGMTLQKIAQFLGHKSIESTQIYTRLVHEMQD